MDPVTLVVVPGFLGGIVLAIAFVHFQRRSLNRRDPFQGDSPTDVINISRIRVAGIGGLGLVAMATIVAIAVPGIGVPLAVSAVLGVVMAVGLIALRRRSGPMPSSGQQAGANTTLSIDAPDVPPTDDRPPAPKARTVVSAPGA